MTPEPSTLLQIIDRQAARSPHRAAWSVPTAAGRRAPVTWAEYRDHVHSAAAWLRKSGVRAGDRVAIMAPTSYAWEVIDKAAVAAGAIVVGIDAHASPQQQSAILRETAPVALALGDPKALAALDLSEAEAPRLVIRADEKGGEADLRPQASIGWRDLLAEPQGDRAPEASPDDVAAIIYTSGTTGAPKGIAYTQRQLLLAASAILETFGPVSEADVALCWLPLTAMFQRIMNLCSVLAGAETYFVESPKEIAAAIAAANPTIFIGVPRFYEKVVATAGGRTATLPWPQRRIAQAALAIGRSLARYRLHDLPAPWHLRLQGLAADLLVLRKIRRRIGGSRMRFMVTGSAPIARSVLEFFDAIELPLLEAYGLSENATPMAANSPRKRRAGSVGRPLPSNELLVAPDGEILVRGPAVFRGYWGADKPSDRFTSDGYFATGDLGYIDADGFLYLRGRKDQLIKTSSGRRVSPALVEAALCEAPLVDQAIVIGNGRPELVALVTLDAERAGAGTVPGNVRDPQAQGRIPDELRDQLAACARRLPPHERIKGCLVLKEPFTIANGQLTPSLKIRRSAVERAYQRAIDGLYAALERSAAAGAKATPSDLLMMTAP